MENVKNEETKLNDIKFDFSNMRSEKFGDKKLGISFKDIMKNSQNVDLAYYKVMDNENLETEAYFDLVRSPQNLNEIKEYANYVAENFENFVVLGIGGSALGARALFSALTSMDYKKNGEKRNNRPNWFVRDSICPEKFASLLDLLDVSKTMFCVVTKSGGTLETLVQLSLVLEKLKEALGENYTKNICAITSNLDGKLNKWATKNNVKTFYFNENVSGRFSVLSAVGLLPAAVVGADIDKLLLGANNMLEKCRTLKFFQNPALYGATLQKIALDKGYNISYLMPYSDNLKILAEWYCQLCAESLGKSVEKNKKIKRVGQTPVKALGTVDQHSQMQLCLEGPYDKTVTFIRVNKHQNDVVIPKESSELLDEYVCGNTLSNILNPSQKATEKALFDRGRMNRTIEVEEIDEYSMGQLLMFFMIETSFMGALLNINTYNQPSVELIKTNIKSLLNEKEETEASKEPEEKAKEVTEQTNNEKEVVTSLVVEPTESTFVADEEFSSEEIDANITQEELERVFAQEDKQILMPEVEEIEKEELKEEAVIEENIRPEQVEGQVVLNLEENPQKPKVETKEEIQQKTEEKLEGQQEFVLDLEEEPKEVKPKRTRKPKQETQE